MNVKDPDVNWFESMPAIFTELSFLIVPHLYLSMSEMFHIFV